MLYLKNFIHIFYAVRQKERIMDISCIAIDLDATLCRFQGGKEGLFSIFVCPQASENDIREIYERVKKNQGFSIAKMQRGVEEKIGKKLDTAKVEQKFSEWLKHSLVLYPDSIPFLARYKAHGHPICIVTFGDTQFQNQKVVALSIPHDKLFVTEKEDGKPRIIRELLKKYGSAVVFIDDKPSELDRIRDQGIDESDVITVQIYREDGPYGGEEPRFEHRKVSSLFDVAPILLSATTHA